jgi:integrase
MNYLGKKDLAKIFRVAFDANRNHHLAMLTAFWAGPRISQVLSLVGRDVFQDNGIWKIKISKLKGGKDTYPEIHIDEQPEFDQTPLIALAGLRGPTALLFGGLSRQYLDLSIKRYGAAAGLHPDYCHMHVFRHSIAMQIWDETKRLGAITEFLGHSSPNSALQYLAENDVRLAQEAVNAVKL